MFPEIAIVRFDSIHFHYLHHYNRLVSSVFLYQHFANDYQWLLINQLDAFLLDDRIDYFCKLGYDYYGAPWKEGADSPLFLFNRRLLKRWGSRFYVGNGGFSLRQIHNTINLLIRKRNHISHHLLSEDLFFGIGELMTPISSLSSRHWRFFFFRNKSSLLDDGVGGAADGITCSV